ncbi:MAG: riboflavin synthase [Phycisphaerales bacterium]|nr:riboflavin synthase [Phycisphaerales bacterium]
MFTGIIRHLGAVTARRPATGGVRLTVDVGSLVESLPHGASVAVNGICLTVADRNDGRVTFDVIGETLRRTTLGDFKIGDPVNLETSLRAGDTIDGHFVQGHVDGTARLTRRETDGGECVLWFDPQTAIRPCLIPKGSVAIDGVSLTIADVDDHLFSVALIPTTLRLTTLGRLRVGDRVNVETDILARTVIHHLTTARTDGPLSLDTLRVHGFA